MRTALARMPARVFYGWWIVLGAFLLRGLGEGLLFHSFGAYFVHLQAEFGWSRTSLAGAASLGRIEGGFLGPLQGWLINRVGSQTVLRAGVVVLAVGFLLFSRVDSLASFYLTYLVIALGSSLCGFLTINLALANWFERRRALAMSLGGTGSALAGLIVLGVAWALDSFGWRGASALSALVMVLVGLPAAQLFRHAPEPYGLVPDGMPNDAAQMPAAAGVGWHPGGFTAREALRTPAFWLLCLGHSSALVAVSAMMVHLIPYLVQQANMSVQTAAGVVTLITIASTGAHVVAGILGDRLDKRLIAFACMGGHTIALVLLVAADSIALVVAFALLHGVAWGIRGPLMMALRADYFGRRSLATIEGFASLLTMLGVVSGPLVAGFMADQMGDYRVGFLVLAGVTAIGSLFFAAARKPAPPTPFTTRL